MDRKERPSLSIAERKALGERVSRRALALRISHADIATAAGVRVLAIGDLVNGKTASPSLPLLRSVAKALKTTVSALVGDEADDVGDTEPLAPEDEVELAIKKAGLAGEVAEKFRTQRQSIGPMPLEALIAWARSIAANKVRETGLAAEGVRSEGERPL